MTLKQLTNILLARMPLIVTTVAVAAATAALISYPLPYQYSAATTVMLDFKSSNPFGVGFSANLPEGYFATQLETIRSPLVLQKVVDRADPVDIELLKLAAARQSASWARLFAEKFSIEQPPDLRALAQERAKSAAESTRPDYLAAFLASNTSVVESRGTRLLTIEFSTIDPELAADMANAIADAYALTNLEMAVAPSRKSSAFLDEHLALLRTKLEQAQGRLTAYQQEQQIVATEEKLDIEVSKLDKLSADLVAARAQARDASNMSRQVEQMIAGGKSLEDLEEFQKNAFVQKLKTDLGQMERQLAELSQQLGTNHPKYQTALSQVQEIRKRLRSEIDAVANNIRNSVTLAEDKVKSQEQALEEQKRLVLELKQQRGHINVLVREVESAQRVYEAALERANNAQLESMVNQANVSVVEVAAPPPRPSSPNLLQNILAAVVLGGLLGAGLGVFLESVDRRVRGEDDLDELLGVPVLATLRRV